MLDIKQIESFYPEYLRSFKQNLLREYFQYKILEIIFDSKWGKGLSFIGGTAIRIVQSHTRFSEDLDFDNLALNNRDFAQLAELIQTKLSMEGYSVEIKNVFKGAFRSYIRISNILFESGLTGHKQKKILIQVDTEPQGFHYQPDKVILNKFDVFLQINVVPADILLSQKIYAVFKRKRAMGRDFYDIVFLLGRTRPNSEYLKLKLKIENMAALKSKILSECRKFNFKRLTKDVEQSLFFPGDAKKILLFEEYIKNYKF